jgi:diguanylate cyclase (GGDEF)-like protein
MTIRKRILLFSALALGAFLTAVFFVSRFALLSGFSRLESNYAHENILHIENHFEDEEGQLAIIARDYAQWDRTYEFMVTHDPDYAHQEITKDTFGIIGINLFVLLDQRGKPTLHRESGNWPIGDEGIRRIAAAYVASPAFATKSPLNGLLDINGRIFLLAYQPILTSRGKGTPRGTLIMGRGLSENLLGSMSRSAGLPLWLEPADNAPSPGSRETLWSDGTNAVSVESNSTMLAYIPLKDFSGTTRRLLVARVPSELHSEGQKVMRYLLLLLMVAGLVHSAVLFFVLEDNLLVRVESLNRKIKQITVSGDLSMRLETPGRDELYELAGAVNAMLTAIQKAKFELLQAQESLRFHAEHDSLTGVLNRRAIRDVLRRELARCRRENQTLGVMLVDVDHFKRINDRYGHGAGDSALVNVVQRISSTLRPYDLIGRYGGEEFLVIAPGCDLELTRKLAERILAAVSDQPVDLGNSTVNLTLSLGATLGTADSDPEFLVAAADSAMYQAKGKGRNRVEISLEFHEQDALQPTFDERV